MQASSSKEDAVAKTDTSLWFGWSSFRPRVLQCLNGPKWFLFFLCQYFFTQSVVVNGVFAASISTIEKRFGYSSSLTGLITSIYDVAAVLITPIVSYMGAKRKKPLWCACGLFTMGLGFVIYVLPHLFAGRYEAGSVRSRHAPSLCSAVNQSSNTSAVHDGSCEQSTSNWGYYALFLLGMFVSGAGCTPMLALGIPYMDENVKPKVAPMYVGIFVSSGIVGSLVGFVLSSVFLSIYVDIGAKSDLTPQDERWVGAWWLGFVVCAIGCAFWSVWLWAYPREFPDTYKLRETTDHKIEEGIPELGFVKLTDILKATKQLFKHLPYVFVTLAGCMHAFGVAWTVAFMPKILQILFQLPPGKASIVYGTVSAPGALLGTLIGSYINKRLKLNCTGAAKMCFIVNIFSVLVSIPLFIVVRCEDAPIAGVDSPYSNRTSALQLMSSCNADCRCTESLKYSPTCGAGLTFYTPCHAGCTQGPQNNTKTYSECSCVRGRDNSTWPRGVAHRGVCRVSCGWKLSILRVLLFFMAFLMFVNNTPATIVTLRAVPSDQRAYAIGLQWDFIRILGAIPGPIVMGSLIDYACVLWETKCGEQGSCLVYNNHKLGLIVVCSVIFTKLVSMISFGLCWFFSWKKGKSAQGELVYLPARDEDSSSSHASSPKEKEEIELSKSTF